MVSRWLIACCNRPLRGPLARRSARRALRSTAVASRAAVSAIPASSPVIRRAGYHRRKDRGAAQWDPLGVAINGVEVLASRSLMHDTLILRLAVPSRTTDIKADELLATSAAGEPGAAKARGLIRRVENLYSGLPAHQKSLTAELEHDQAQLDDLLANPPAPFEHSDGLDAKKAELSA